jgi:hypothetical protein
MEDCAFATADSQPWWICLARFPSCYGKLTFVLRKVNTSSFDTIDLDVYARSSVSRGYFRISNLLSLEIEQALGLKRFPVESTQIPCCERAKLLVPSGPSK